MPTKRKAESDHNATTLLDFFSPGSSSKTSPSKKVNGSKRQKLDTPSRSYSSTVAGSSSLASGGRQHSRSENSLQRKNTVPIDADVIEVLDSDDEEPKETFKAKSKHSEKLPGNTEPPTVKQSLVKPTSYITSEGVPSYEDYEAFFLDSDAPNKPTSDASKNGADKGRWVFDDQEVIDLEDDEEAEEVGLRLERMSPFDWEEGEDDEAEGHASAAASEPEEEGENAVFTLSVQEEAELVDDDQMEVDPSEIEYIELEDDSPTTSPISSTQGLCPICRKDISSYNDSVNPAVIH
jgi:hypothetical protein